MYFCKNCNTGFSTKVTRCELCNSDDSITRIKGSGVTVEEIIFNYDADTIAQLFPDIIIEQGYSYNRSSYPYYGNRLLPELRARPLGIIHDNLEAFQKLSREELNTLLKQLYGRTSRDLPVVTVPIKCSLSDKFILMPMRVDSIVDWTKNNNVTFEIHYYEKRSWILGNDRTTEDYQAVLDILLANRDHNRAVVDSHFRYSNAFFDVIDRP